MSFVKGSYNSVEEALEAAKQLKAEGYSSKDITLISNNTTRDSFMNNSDVKMESPENYNVESNHSTAGVKEDESLWDKIVNAFTVEDEYDNRTSGSNEDPLAHYRNDIQEGKVVVLAEGKHDGMSDSVDYTMHNDESNRNPNLADNQTVELSEERLEVDTNEVQTGEVHVSKRVVEDRESVDVPVDHEEVVIERHSVEGDREVTDNHEFKDEEFTIPVNEEQIDVNKKSVVTEEVSIGKERVTDNKHVEETVRREELDVDTEGDIDVNDVSRNNRDERF
ncbi:DUF2382 domain-containing protein [Phocicoccus pinnipedialis]|uniref:Stress response protein YsnF n=1 Tax=Phocicoccus pinnipedialis TaxID=110845 RepID=A0A6V7RCX5_9BACL|nr:DUF2382 domain-containing protein [Jeotgalicoccus pinnipedialis]MBP1939873.1 uncharacterized protein (TIGR02271 family) [Jeotgalicoccus pinnipedialis]CAD2074645.1 Stress response protein YsnF [Jeotgalicoccus pinnipedialis]